MQGDSRIPDLRRSALIVHSCPERLCRHSLFADGIRSVPSVNDAIGRQWTGGQRTIDGRAAQRYYRVVADIVRAGLRDGLSPLEAAAGCDLGSFAAPQKAVQPSVAKATENAGSGGPEGWGRLGGLWPATGEAGLRPPADGRFVFHVTITTKLRGCDRHLIYNGKMSFPCLPRGNFRRGPRSIPVLSAGIRAREVRWRPREWHTRRRAFCS